MISLLGMLVLMLIAYALSTNRKAVNFRTVLGALGLQIGIGAFVLYLPAGKTILETISNGAAHLISYTDVGIKFMFGNLAFGELGFIFAINVLSIVVFFSALMSVLYYVGIMKWIIAILGGSISRMLKTSKTESLSAAANIFVGQTEAPLVIKPYIPTMTRSQLFAVMTGGLASVAGSVMFGYASMGIDMQYLIAASFMAAPGGLLMAKLLVPETETSAEKFDAEPVEDEDGPVNIFDAAATGASSGMQLALNIGAMLLAFVALIALVNGILGALGGFFGAPDLTLQFLLGYLFAPIAWLIGIPWSEAMQAGSFIGQKLVINEFVAYLDFVNYQDQMSDLSKAIITIALCGFANLSSIAILLGGLGVIAPDRRSDIAELGLRAVLAGSMSNLMSAAIAGLFLSLAV